MSEIEETLRRRMAAAEETLADTVWDYARFCQREKVPERAIPRLERLAEYASNPQMRAKLWLAIGQLNETQHTYQAAAQAYARGNALGPSERPPAGAPARSGRAGRAGAGAVAALRPERRHRR